MGPLHMWLLGGGKRCQVDSPFLKARKGAELYLASSNPASVISSKLGVCGDLRDQFWINPWICINQFQGRCCLLAWDRLIRVCVYLALHICGTAV